MAALQKQAEEAAHICADVAPGFPVEPRPVDPGVAVAALDSCASRTEVPGGPAQDGQDAATRARGGAGRTCGTHPGRAWPRRSKLQHTRIELAPTRVRSLTARGVRARVFVQACLRGQVRGQVRGNTYTHTHTHTHIHACDCAPSSRVHRAVRTARGRGPHAARYRKCSPRPQGAAA